MQLMLVLTGCILSLTVYMCFMRDYFFKGKSIKVLQGWPPHKRYWHTVKYYPKTNQWETKEDRNFRDIRPRKYPIECNVTVRGKHASNELYERAIRYFETADKFRLHNL